MAGKTARLLVQADGTVKFVYADTLQPIAKALGEATTTRASHVEPDGDGWYVDLSPSGGPTVRGFATRQAALDFEVQWLNEHVLK